MNPLGKEYFSKSLTHKKSVEHKNSMKVFFSKWTQL